LVAFTARPAFARRPEGGWLGALMKYFSEFAAIAAVMAAVASTGCSIGDTRLAGLEQNVRELKDGQARIIDGLEQLRIDQRRSPQELELANSEVEGDADAIVVLAEFADYECPYCQRYATEVLSRIEHTYVATGKVEYAFFDFPIAQLHMTTMRAHAAARCAAEEGRFWQIHRALFAPPGSHSEEALMALATGARLDVTRFRSCLESGRTLAIVHDEVAYGHQIGVKVTPTFYVGLKGDLPGNVRILATLQGAQPYADFAKVLDAAIDTAAATRQ
jgi:protein-disulfide isomerase